MIAEILAEECVALGVALSDENILSFTVFAEELKKWNRTVNLTAITRDKEIAVKHFIDSLHLAAHVSEHDRLLDMGSGAGFPVIPLKIVRAATPMVSVDAVAKKINFQRHIIRTLKLHGIEAVHARIEDLHATYAHTFTLITSRAFTRIDHFVSLASPLLSRNGRLIAMKGAGVDEEIDASSDVLSALGFSVTAQYRYSLPYNMGERTLTVMMPCKAA